MNFKLLVVAIFLMFAFGGAVRPQDEEIRIRTDLVTVNVTVTDRNGKNVTGLKKENFRILDNRKKQDIEYFSAELAPAVYGIVYDLHPSTVEQMESVLESLRAFTQTLGKEDRFFLTAFNHYGSLKVEFIPTAEQINRHLSVGSRFSEPNSLYDAVYDAAERIRESRSLKRTLIVISDSADHSSRHSYSELSRQIKGLDVQVYAVIFDFDAMRRWAYSDVTGSGNRPVFTPADAGKLDRVALQELTMKSGGASHFPATQDSFELFQIYQAIGAEVRDRYALSFYPTDVDGKWHNLVIGIDNVKNRKELVLNYRYGYQSAKPESKDPMR